MWFKNLYVLSLKVFDTTAEQLDESLRTKPFVEVGNEQRESAGFIAPVRGNESLVHAANGCILLTLAHQERMLPESVVREELDKAVAAIESKESRKVGNEEKKDLREQIEFELLPQAFTRTKKVDAWIDQKNGWLVINTASATVADRVTKYLRTCLQSLPVAHIMYDANPSVAMTQWLKQEFSPAPFTLGESCQLRGQGKEKSTAEFKRHELTSGEVLANIEAGKVATKLGLVWDEKISFTLTGDGQITGVKFLDVLEDRMKEEDPQSAAEELDIEFTLMTGEVARMLNDLMSQLNDCTDGR